MFLKIVINKFIQSVKKERRLELFKNRKILHPFDKNLQKFLLLS